MTAMVRNLATMTRVGLLAPGSAGTAKVVAQLGDRERIRKARVHPIALLAALRTYAAGHGVRGQAQLDSRCGQIVDALDAAFYTAFENVEPTGKRLLLALDVSGSMAGGAVAGVPGPDPARRVGGAGAGDGGDRARYEIVGFYAGRGGFRSRAGAVARHGRRPHAARDQPAAAAGRRRADGERPAVRRHRLRAADAVGARTRA